MNKNPLIVALDFPDSEATLEFLAHFSGEQLYVKVGMELYYKEGPAVIETLKHQGHHIFLDLKLHDIPNTVKSAMKNLAVLGVDLVNVHAAGGRNMMEAAIEGLEAGTKPGAKRPSCIAVTQLTSTSEEMLHHELLIPGSLEHTVLKYAELAHAAGLDGIVSSVLEVPAIYSILPHSFLTVTPGIREFGAAKADQVRVATPRFAGESGASGIVVGRSITRADHPVEAYKRISSEWEDAVNERKNSSAFIKH
ncbi:orotidine-5'-phosphate decarboxylase [Bacillus lacus]|uniref:Orotidine 5'-phosphate decarboxylase n=1 Tax=Metabacillus lacus TaxID=1983721 RepID=A0A7X2J0R9_9BACI|nr:orotidine-5'-phosphate decarboxylase [Metabacillus lacus]MRX73337.1 orotidine-5'-phosphate decarboxylase [Metabacillus lacus]